MTKIRHYAGNTYEMDLWGRMKRVDNKKTPTMKKDVSPKTDTETPPKKRKRINEVKKTLPMNGKSLLNIHNGT